MIRMLRRAALPAVLFAVTLAAAAAHADTRLVYASASGPFIVDLQPGAVRIDDASQTWQLYKQTSQTIFSVQPGERTYVRLDNDVAGTIRARMEALRARVEQRIQQLPEDRRAAARAALTDQIPGLNPTTQTVGLDHTGQTDTVAGVSCEVVQVVRNGQAAETLCVADAEALGISRASFDTVQSMFSLMKTMLSGTGFESVGLPYLSLSGMPVRFTDRGSGERRVLAEIHHDDLPAARFSIPENYTPKAPPTPGQ